MVPSRRSAELEELAGQYMKEVAAGEDTLNTLMRLEPVFRIS